MTLTLFNDTIITRIPAVKHVRRSAFDDVFDLIRCVAKPIGDVDTLYIARTARLAYRVEVREDRLPAEAVVRVTVEVGELRRRVDREVGKLR